MIETSTGPSVVHSLIEHAAIELVPMKSLTGAVAELPARSHVSMTCSPAKSIEFTLDETAALLAAGHHVTPHIAARMVRSADHLREIHARLVELDVRDVFVVAGDADPPGCFFDAIEFIEALVSLDDAGDARQIDHIGFTSYPDTHPIISTAQLHDALHRKQELVLASGRTAHVATQMCFSADRIDRWLVAERAAGFRLPVRLGLPGVIDTAKLLTMGMRLGVGTSLRYLSKNRSALGKLMTQRSYEPDQLLRPLADRFEPLGIDGLHLFTFNQVAATEAWRRDALGRY